jgi:hypothetical protein
MASIRLTKLSKAFPNCVQAVRDVNPEVADGEFIVLMGSSGCGGNGIASSFVFVGLGARASVAESDSPGSVSSICRGRTTPAASMRSLAWTLLRQIVHNGVRHLRHYEFARLHHYFGTEWPRGRWQLHCNLSVGLSTRSSQAICPARGLDAEQFYVDRVPRTP